MQKGVGNFQLLLAWQVTLAQAEADVVTHREPGEQRVALKHHAAVGAGAVTIAFAVEQHLAARLFIEPATMRSSVLFAAT